jgi:DNA repair protein RecN (Recombination protein N)
MDFGDGLNLLTGETGAGKSIIIDSINAILGGRASRELIRTGSDKAFVQAVFSDTRDKVGELLQNAGIETEADGTVIVAREFTVSGRNLCRVNGTMVTVSFLRELGSMLIDVHGQHDNQSLLNVETHIELLDLFAGEELHTLNKEYRELLEKRKSLKQRLVKISGEGTSMERKLDLLKFQIDEIKESKLKTGEEEQLNTKRQLMGGAEKITATLNYSYEAIYEGEKGRAAIMDVLNKCAADIAVLSRFGENYDELSKKLYEVVYLLEDICENIRDERDKVDFEPGLLEKLDERLDIIYRLKKKYGNSIEEVLKYYDEIIKEYEELVNSEELVAQLQKELGELEKEMFRLAAKMHEKRKAAAEILEKRIVAELEDLELKRADFKVNLVFDEGKEGEAYKFTSNGLDHVEYLFSANAGEPVKPLSKIASGGEMSRVMLAIKTILADVDSVPTLIFDEIDTGISGRAAQKVGEKLSFISRSHQVLCVTHLPQIAAMADNHFLIEKHSLKENTVTDVILLNDEGTANELARILGGANITDITLSHAKEMLESAREFKKESVL